MCCENTKEMSLYVVLGGVRPHKQIGSFRFSHVCDLQVFIFCLVKCCNSRCALTHLKNLPRSENYGALLVLIAFFVNFLFCIWGWMMWPWWETVSCGGDLDLSHYFPYPF